MGIIIMSPIAAALLILLFRKQPAVFGLAGSLASLAGSLTLLFRVTHGTAGAWQMPGLPGMPFILQAEPFTAAFSLIVAVVTFFIFIYGKGYMTNKKGKRWFWSGMSLFIASMQLLVLSADWISFITGWELMGLASYLLIATWHWEAAARLGAAKAFMLTRFTDLGLYVGVFIIILQTESSLIRPSLQYTMPLTGALALLLAVMGKSAQVPFQSWLSSAMAGPTPVSTLLHSATMVAAGVALLIKVFPMLPPEGLFYTGLAGSVTILLTGLTALVSNDIKQLLAASTSSQLGFMLLAVAAGYPGAAAAHLFAHAFMKSSLFLGAGIFQHANNSTSFEDIRGSGKKKRWAFGGWAIAGLALAGIPPLIGYWSKDAVLAAGFLSAGAIPYFGIAVAGALLTALYMGRSIRLLWLGSENPVAGFRGLLSMRAGLILLTVFVAAGGFYLPQVLRFTGFILPGQETAKVVGLMVAIAGLVTGAFIRVADFKRRPLRFIQANYPVAGGYWALVSPVLRLASFCSRADIYLHKAVVSAAGAFVKLAKVLTVTEDAIRKLPEGTGLMSLKLSALIRQADESGIERALDALTGSVKRSGEISRKIQSGLIYKELLWSLATMMLLAAVLWILLI